MNADRYELARLLGALAPARLRRFAAPPFLGYVEATRAEGGRLHVSGWLFNRGVAITRLSITSRGGAEAALAHGVARPDVARRFDGEPRAHASGFHGALPLDWDRGRATELHVWAHLADGRRVACFRFDAAVRPAALARLGAPAQAIAARARRAPLKWIDWAAERLAKRRMLPRFEAALRACAAGDAPGLEAHAPELFDALWTGFGGARGALALELALRRASTPVAPRPRRAREPAQARESAAANGGRARRSILFVSGMFPSIEHGGGLRLFDIVEALGRRHDVDLYSRYREELDRASFARLAPSLRAARLVPADVPGAADARAWLERNQHPRGGYDVIHFEYGATAHLIPVLRPFARKTIFTLMECVTRRTLIDLALLARQPQPPERADLERATKEFLNAFILEKDALAACDQGIAVTDEDADFAARSFGVPRPVVVPTCLSETAFLDGVSAADRAPLAPRTAAFVGYYDHYPNIDAMRWYLQNVHFAVLKQIPDYRLHIIGRGETAPLRALYPNEPSIVFVGRVDELAPHLQAAQIGLAPIVSGAGIRGKINQYSAVGRPTVSTSLGASGLPYRHEQSILIADKPDEFARAVTRLLTDAVLWKRLQAGAREVAETRFRWPQAIARLEALHVA
jgi:glycosyltransferase involved in cell wall biosynthesis